MDKPLDQAAHGSGRSYLSLQAAMRLQPDIASGKREDADACEEAPHASHPLVDVLRAQLHAVHLQVWSLIQQIDALDVTLDRAINPVPKPHGARMADVSPQGEGVPLKETPRVFGGNREPSSQE